MTAFKFLSIGEIFHTGTIVVLYLNPGASPVSSTPPTIKIPSATILHVSHARSMREPRAYRGGIVSVVGVSPSLVLLTYGSVGIGVESEVCDTLT